MKRARLVSLTACLLLGACVSDPPDLPGRGMLRSSTWIPGGTSTSFSPSGGPVEIVNRGTSELRIGTGPDAVVLLPGEGHLVTTPGTEIFNPTDGRVLVELRDAPSAAAQPKAPLPTTIGVVPAQAGDV